MWGTRKQKIAHLDSRNKTVDVKCKRPQTLIHLKLGTLVARPLPYELRASGCGVQGSSQRCRK